MGGSVSVENIMDATVDIMVQATFRSMSSCTSTLDASQVMNLGCQFSVQELEAKSNSRACMRCQDTYYARYINPGACEIYCAIPCNYQNLRQEGIFQMTSDCKQTAA